MGGDIISRAVFRAALVAGLSYFLAVLWQTSQVSVGVSSDVRAVLIAWKGAGVALLAVWCALQARSFDGWLIAAVMAFGALGDVLLEAVGMTTGAVAFVVGHVLAMLLYFRNRRPQLTSSQRLLAALVVPLLVIIAASLVLPKDMVPIAAYAVFVGAMAASAWISHFPRYRVGIGAMMFLASDLLIFAQMGVLAGSPVPGLLIWPLYFGGQVLIAWGVVQTLAQDAPVNNPRS